MLKACPQCGAISCTKHGPTRSPSSRATGHRAHKRRRTELQQTTPWICHICHEPILTNEDYQADHLLPVAHGGAHGTLAPAHAYCNNARGAR